MIHKSGTVATFWQTSLVIARNMTEASAGKAIQAPRSHQLTDASVAAPTLRLGELKEAAACDCLARYVHHAQKPQQIANTAKPSDHMNACWRESQYNSKKNG